MANHLALATVFDINNEKAREMQERVVSPSVRRVIFSFLATRCISGRLTRCFEDFFRNSGVEFPALQVDKGDIGIHVVVSDLFEREGISFHNLLPDLATVEVHATADFHGASVLVAHGNHDFAFFGYNLFITNNVIEDSSLASSDLGGNAVDYDGAVCVDLLGRHVRKNGIFHRAGENLAVKRIGMLVCDIPIASRLGFGFDIQEFAQEHGFRIFIIQQQERILGV
mmetsp:Transcript_24004/g.66521  ORF Transcript_24004/g.66521 Transcript_24004/m.66521 type:complete len:226 (-) Transcript_24004:1294-1971(-)